MRQKWRKESAEPSKQFSKHSEKKVYIALSMQNPACVGRFVLKPSIQLLPTFKASLKKVFTTYYMQNQTCSGRFVLKYLQETKSTAKTNHVPAHKKAQGSFEIEEKLQ